MRVLPRFSLFILSATRQVSDTHFRFNQLTGLNVGERRHSSLLSGQTRVLQYQGDLVQEVVQPQSGSIQIFECAQAFLLPAFLASNPGFFHHLIKDNQGIIGGASCNARGT